MKSRLSVVVNMKTRAGVAEFRSGSVGATNVLGLHLDPSIYLRMGGIDAHYMSLTVAERWGSRPLPPHTVAVLQTSVAEQREGFPPYILTGIVLDENDPDTSDFVIPILARAIDAVLAEMHDSPGGTIQTIAFTEQNLRIGGATLAQVGRLMAETFG